MPMQTRFPNRVMPYLLLAPMVVVLIIVFIFPSFESLQLSFLRVSPLGDRRLFVGFENFIRLFTKPDYLNSLWVTARFSVFVVFVGLATSMVVAVVANQRLRGFSFYRALLIWPYALSPAIARLGCGLVMSSNFCLGSILAQPPR